VSRIGNGLRPICESAHGGATKQGVSSVKYLLIMNINPSVLEALSEDERNAIGNGHADFMRTIQESGEMISTNALADPANSVVVRFKGGEQVVTDGPFVESKEYFGGYYLVDCETKERAIELAGMIPDAKVEGLGIEIRPVMFSAGSEM
jgi:hypothetical protein